jgi:hypothetical protein
MKFSINQKLEALLYTIALFGLLESSLVLASSVEGPSSAVASNTDSSSHGISADSEAAHMFGLKHRRFESEELADSEEFLEEQLKSMSAQKQLINLLLQMLSAWNSGNYNSAFKRDTIKRPFNPQTSSSFLTWKNFSNQKTILLALNRMGQTKPTERSIQPADQMGKIN